MFGMLRKCGLPPEAVRFNQVYGDGLMHRLIWCIFIGVMFSSSGIAQVPGSTGGAIGKQDKSVSGGTTPDASQPPTTKPKSSVARANTKLERIPLVTGQYEVVAQRV
jgi:hypothetical protein